jgi:hypothetical protein
LAGQAGDTRLSRPYTHAAHYERCVAAAKLGQVIAHQHVQVIKQGVHYCARIRSSWTTPDGLDCWTIETLSPEIAHFTVPCKQVRLCGQQGSCVCVAAPAGPCVAQAQRGAQGAAGAPEDLTC